ncbi:MAG: N-acetylglucosamine kinase [Synechococcus sp.]
MLIGGFDAGQTHTRCRLQWLEPNGLWDGQTGPDGRVDDGEGSGVCHLDAPGGETQFQAALRSSLQAALKAAKRPLDTRLNAAVVGASGIEQGSNLQQRGQQLLSEVVGLSHAQTLVTGDERTALHGAFPTGAGIALISGTGMICIGRDHSGREHRCGGWGWRLDGAGSAFDIGHQGLQLSLRMADGRVAETPLRHRLWKALNCDSPAAIKALAAGPTLDVASLAGLAPLVHAQAVGGDREAEAVLVHSATALAQAVAAVTEVLSLQAPAISAQGGAITHLPYFRSLVSDQLDQRLGLWHWATSGGDACDGALSLARDLVRY